jgi:serine-threonine kinase receptor-associated protein
MATSTTTAQQRQIPIVCPGHTRPLAELQFSSITPSNKNKDAVDTFLVSACHDKSPMVRNGKTGDWIGTFAGHKGAVWSTKLDPSANLAATASGDFSVRVWDAITGASLFSFQHKHIVKSVDFSLNSKFLATGGHEGILRIYNLEKNEMDPVCIHQIPDKKITITKCVWLNNSVVLAAGSDGNIRLWDVKNTKLIHTLSVNAEVRDVEFSPLKKILTVAAGDIVSFFQLDMADGDEVTDITGKLVHAHKMPIHFRDEGGASLHTSGTKFVAGGSDLWVRVFDFETGEEMECHRGHHGPVRCVRYSPLGDTYATGSEDGTIRLWKTDP